MRQEQTNEKQPNFIKSTLEFIFLLMVVFLVRTFGFGLYQVPTGSMETTMLVGERFFSDKLSYWFRKPVKGEIIAFNDPYFTYSANPIVRLYQQYIWGPNNWTKRIIAGPGDKIRGTVENGKSVIYLNDQKLDEPYLNKYPLITLYAETQLSYGDVHYVGRTTSRSYDPDKAYDEQPFYNINPTTVKLQDGMPILDYPGAGRKSALSWLKGKCYWSGSDEFYVELGANQYWVMGDNRQGSQDSRWFGPINGNVIHGRILFRIWSVDTNASWWIVDLIKNPIDFFKRTRWSRIFQLIS